MRTLFLSGSLLCAMLSAHAACASEPVRVRMEAAPACIDVEVNGARIPAYDCLTEKLNPPPVANRSHPEGRLLSEQIATRPSNQTALFNRAATSQRMGNTFGRSVHSQRPPPPALPPPVKQP